MRWWVDLNCEYCGNPLPVESHSEGGTYVYGGIDRAELNITYNHSAHLEEGLGYHFDKLSGKRAKDTIPALEKAVERLGTERTENYWESTPGNAGYALSILLKWARQHPDGIWRIR